MIIKIISHSKFYKFYNPHISLSIAVPTEGVKTGPIALLLPFLKQLTDTTFENPVGKYCDLGLLIYVFFGVNFSG